MESVKQPWDQSAICEAGKTQEGKPGKTCKGDGATVEDLVALCVLLDVNGLGFGYPAQVQAMTWNMSVP